MSKKTKLIPELRFPEFVDEEEWEEKELNSLGELINGLTYSPNDVRGKGLLVLRSSNILNGLIALNDCVYVRTDIKGANFSEPNDILICVRNGSKSLIGKNAIIPKGIPFATHGAFMTVFRAEKPEFVFQLFQTERYERQVKADLGATINSINSKNFLKYKFIVPKNPEEQQKIASCLSSLDEVIAAESQKLDLLKDHKKGLMQKLFPQEGEKVPKYRFKEFENDGNWVEKKLKNVSIKIQDGTHFSPKTFDKGDYLYITSKNVKNGYLDISNAQFISKENHEVIYKRCDVKEGDVLLTKDGTIGQSCVNNLTIPFSLLSSVAFIRLKPNYSNYFLYHLFVSQIGQSEINSQIAGQALRRITLSKINNFSFLFPSFKEQQKIASCLSSLDALITAQTEKIEQLKLHKKGLMQGLFPKIND